MAKKTQANRGLSFEKEIQKICDELKKKGIALISKIPTEITMIRSFKGGKSQIVNAFPKEGSRFVDFCGVLKGGKAVAIEAKETKELTRFPLANIKESQTEFLRDWIKLGAVGYYLIRFTEYKKVFLVEAKFLENTINTIGRKSIPYQWFLDTKEVIELDYNKLNFIDYLNK